MKQKLTMIYGSIFILITGISCTTNKTLKPFTSDGCSLFPDRSLLKNEDWCECCVKHDLAYWKGGSEEERAKADLDLKRCVIEKTRDTTLANLMYMGVRMGGSPYFPTWYRWGYGWNYQRGYQPLSPEEKRKVKRKLERTPPEINACTGEADN
ncbi:MAG: hypothetical protein P8X42_03270 [Calditrichaceae bacterium]|jgi:hypothetical protein